MYGIESKRSEVRMSTTKNTKTPQKAGNGGNGGIAPSDSGLLENRTRETKDGNGSATYGAFRGVQTGGSRGALLLSRLVWVHGCGWSGLG